MVHVPAVCWVLAILAAACELLAAFGIDAVGQIQLVPLGLTFIALYFVGHHAHTA